MMIYNFCVFLIALVGCFGLKNHPKLNDDECVNVPIEDRYDCYPEANANQVRCEARGCCYNPAKIGVPTCYFPPSYVSYDYINVTETDYGVTAFLQRVTESPFPGDVEILQLIAKYETDTRLHIKIIDPINQRFETPYPPVPDVNEKASNPQYIFDIDESRPGFRVIRASDNTAIFDSNNFINFIYSDQFIQISTRLSSEYIYGLGEQQNTLALSTDWSQITLFNRDNGPIINTNLYGSHPFYVAFENSTNSHGVFLLNSNAIEVVIQPTPAITLRTLGGILNLYFFLGPTPGEVVKQYQELVGLPTFPPYWSLGFHLCRYGYGSLDETKAVMQRNIDAGIPLDVQWNDIDYMDRRNDFTYDKDTYDGLPEFVNDLHSRGMHYVVITDPGVSASEEPGTYPPFDIGIEMDVFVKNASGLPLIGKVWNPESTAYPDFTHTNATAYWTQMIQNFHDEIDFDGIWIDMNEPSNFVEGSQVGCPDSNLEDPHYLPRILLGGKLRASTLCMTAQHEAGSHYDLHNQYGLTEAIITNTAMKTVTGKRPMIISRSSFSGHGHYAGHWSGDIISIWFDLKYSISNMLSFSLFGVPLMGADICGFRGSTNEQLCNRWTQLGAFYPFSRNHNDLGSDDQDPAIMGELVIKSTITTLEIRYSLLPYLYTLFYKATTKGDTVARPLFIEFPQDPNTYKIDTQFLWGSALLINPVVEENAVSVSAYFPRGIWYDFYTSDVLNSTGETYLLDAPLDTIPLFLRGGSVIPRQLPANTTTVGRKSPIFIQICLDENGAASGELYWDDGDSLDVIEEGRYTLISFNVTQNIIFAKPIQYNSDEELPRLSTVAIWGVNYPVTKAKINGDDVAFTQAGNNLGIFALEQYSWETDLEIGWY